jgi:protein gp37
MTLCEQHIFIILTKRPDRMNRYIETTWGNQMYGGFPNVWLGVTAENQEEADKRIPILLRTPAAKRFVSCEPLLSPINFFVPGHRITGIGAMALRLGIDWVIVGGESGPGARPMRPEWVRDVRKQCVVAGVPFFFKQWGEWLHDDEALCPGECSIGYHAQGDMLRIGKRRAGRELDGRTWEEFPK